MYHESSGRSGFDLIGQPLGKHKSGVVPRISRRVSVTSSEKELENPSAKRSCINPLTKENHSSSGENGYDKKLNAKMVKRDIIAWGPTDVCEFLHRIGLGQYQKAFEENGVDGEILLDLCGVDPDDLKLELGVKKIHQGKLKRKISALTS